MSSNTAHVRKVKREVHGSDFAESIESITDRFEHLKEDFAGLLQDAKGVGTSGVEAIKEGASTAITEIEHRLGDLKKIGGIAVHRVEDQFEERPILSTAIAMGVGYFLFRLFIRR
jgi:ElaB/YqjD/DUF883 family membrane-anchored ribosome-binding protein